MGESFGTDYVYTPSTIEKWVRSWPELCTKAETPGTSYGLMLTGPTPATPKLGTRQRGFSGDKLNFAVLKADIESAWRSLPSGIEHDIVTWVMFGFSLSSIATDKRMGKQRVVDAFHDGTKQMAIFLGWAETEEDQEYPQVTSTTGIIVASAT